MTFLAIDIGNTRLKWALYAGAQYGAALLAQGGVSRPIDTLSEGVGPLACAHADAQLRGGWQGCEASGGAANGVVGRGPKLGGGQCSRGGHGQWV